MERDIRSSKLYAEVLAVFNAWHHPESGLCSDGEHLSVSADGNRLAFTGTFFSSLDTSPRTRIGLLEAGGASTQPHFIQRAANNDRLPLWSPCGRWLAFSSDRTQPGRFQLIIVAAGSTTEVVHAAEVTGCVEALSWSPDGQKVLLGVAGLGADLAGCQGGAKIAAAAEDLPQWMPQIDTGDAGNLWRTAWIYELGSKQVREIPTAGINVWESAWLGNDAVLAVVSHSHSEGSWYQSRLVTISLQDGAVQTLFRPQEQIGLPCANSDGSIAAIVEAVCSDRMIVAGKLRLIVAATGLVTAVDTLGVDITHLAWRNRHILTYTGLRGFETVVGEVDTSIATSSGSKTSVVREIWRDKHRTMGAWYPSVAPLATGGFAAWIESYSQQPQLIRFDGQSETVLLDLENPDRNNRVSDSGRAEAFSWIARDGLEMQGWLIRPHNHKEPVPMVVDIHGGPVWACRNRWMGRLRGAKTLVDHGCALLYPNPRGSSGRGQEFAAMVRGDMGGEDTHDYLTGIDALVERGIADPARIGVTGISYGGFMSSWLITQDDRFAAAVPISPVTNWYSQHGTSQIPFFDEYFLGGKANEADGKFFHRSPVMFAHRVKCPTLTLTGALDQNTPPTQALEFHRALLEHGVKSVLATYPTAGHGIRSFPEVIDHTTRYVGWFIEHLRLQQQATG
jgi:dipeptidyl aminopeptidase/acylaminoacyl peptidase